MGKITIEFNDTEDIAMAIPLLLALSICPAMLGTQEGIRQSQAQNRREEHRSRRCNLMVSCIKPSNRKREIDGTLVMLKDAKVTVDSSTPCQRWNVAKLPVGQLYLATHNLSEGHLFAGYYLPYPDSTYEGLVSTISDDPPMLNWIYVDKNTHEVKYGERSAAQQHLTGPFDCTRQDRRLTLEGWEGFAAVEELPGIWALYFDRDDDGLVTKVPLGTRVLEVELDRREKKEPKPSSDVNQPQTDQADERAEQRESVDGTAGTDSHEHPDATLGQGGRGMASDRVDTLDSTYSEEGVRLARSGVASDEHHHVDDLPGTPSATTDVVSRSPLSWGYSEDDSNFFVDSPTPGSSNFPVEHVREERRTVYETPYVEDEDPIP
ncbi:hypothetical protein H634G_09393 [Metarhizium anisopliae BRIP 53293]|uniref:Uncharacterized protein n=1 Tax=Metarhizium anisopliae BRIP 53293 TaxID=1291518 RepID=A0A0D9NRW1_METAN|nr:hypothetical protein H634G_09393 [Metarhizium anisopliae BRIP 53293]KJK91790.1 hypothetical protein H633G_04406 [Metarhizium anisopliae BRIP 53284]